MSVYFFGLESFTATVCRSPGGPDDDWLIVTLNIGTRLSDQVVCQLNPAMQAGQGLVFQFGYSPSFAGPYPMQDGETAVATYTIVHLGGGNPGDDDAQSRALAAGISKAVTGAVHGGSSPAGGPAAAAIQAAILGVFGAHGEVLGASPLAAGQVDSRGLVGTYVVPFTTPSAPAIGEVANTGPVTLIASAPSGSLAGPQSTAVLSVWRSTNLFTQSTPLTVLASGPALTEIFAVGTDGLLRYNVRGADGSFGAWQARWTQTFSQSAPLVALSGLPQRKDVFGTGADGVIYRMSASQGSDWGDWTAVSAVGQFLPDTPVSAISLSGVLSVFAVDPDGVAQSITWNGDAVLFPWAPLPGMVFARRTSLLVISHIDTWVEVFAVDPLGHDYHTSRANNQPAWGPWQMIGGSPFAVEPTSRKYLGLTFSVFSAPNVSTELGMTWFRVDGGGSVNELGWTNATGWIGRNILAGVKTIFAGSVSGVRLGNQLLLYMVDARTAQIGVTSWPMPFPSGPNPGWSAWTLLPPGPALAKEREITAISTDDSHVELFVVDREGVVQHVIEDTGPGWGTWSVV